METFECYLQLRGFSQKTISTYTHYWQAFSGWATWRGLPLTTLRYEDLLDYMQYLGGQGKSKGNINLHLLAIRHHLDWWLSGGVTDYNPATGLWIKGLARTVPKDLLDPEALDALYEQYAVDNARTHRNKVIIGLLVYQGLTREELERLQAKNFDLATGQIHVTATSKRAKGRSIPLEAKQLLLLQDYLQTVRPALLQILGQPALTPLLFNQEGLPQLGNVLSQLMRELKPINPQVKNANQLRLSVITHWLQSKDVRMVQYLAGHRYVSSTERYQTSDLKALQEELTKFHPLP